MIINPGQFFVKKPVTKWYQLDSYISGRKKNSRFQCRLFMFWMLERWHKEGSQNEDLLENFLIKENHEKYKRQNTTLTKQLGRVSSKIKLIEVDNCWTQDNLYDCGICVLMNIKSILLRHHCYPQFCDDINNCVPDDNSKNVLSDAIRGGEFKKFQVSKV